MFSSSHNQLGKLMEMLLIQGKHGKQWCLGQLSPPSLTQVDSVFKMSLKCPFIYILFTIYTHVLIKIIAHHTIIKVKALS